MGGLESLADRIARVSIKGQWMGGGDSGQEESGRTLPDFAGRNFVFQSCFYD